MEMQELFDAYLQHEKREEENLMIAAFDDVCSSQYEEAAERFNQLYGKNPQDYVSYFLRAYCKSHLGVRGNVYPDSQTLTSAFDLTIKKFFNSESKNPITFRLIISLYEDAMDNLFYNDPGELKIGSNGSSYTTYPARAKIISAKTTHVRSAIESNVEKIKKNSEMKKFCIQYLKDSGSLYDLRIVCSLDSSYQSEYDKKLKEKDARDAAAKKRNIIIGIVIAIFFAICLLSGLLGSL